MTKSGALSKVFQFRLLYKRYGFRYALSIKQSIAFFFKEEEENTLHIHYFIKREYNSQSTSGKKTGTLCPESTWPSGVGRFIKLSPLHVSVSLRLSR